MTRTRSGLRPANRSLSCCALFTPGMREAIVTFRRLAAKPVPPRNTADGAVRAKPVVATRPARQTIAAVGAAWVPKWPVLARNTCLPPVWSCVSRGGRRRLFPVVWRRHRNGRSPMTTGRRARMTNDSDSRAVFDWCCYVCRRHRTTSAAGRPESQYAFFGGNDRFICLRSLDTAAAFFLLRLAVGFSYAILARSSFSRPVLSIERRKRRKATSTGSFSLGMTVVNFFPCSDPDGRHRRGLERICGLPLARRIVLMSSTVCAVSFRRD